ncbi:hypothetical protein HKBW3S44_01596, partial [Candidatus Hakubella thermalkaliphila]
SPTLRGETKSASSKLIKIGDDEENMLTWHSQSILNLPFTTGAVHIIYGPRQVGKSTALKLLIRKLLAKYDAHNIFYFNCDLLATRKDLVELLTDYLNWVKAKRGKKFLFLDEISSLPDWPFAIKWLIDSGLGKNAVFFLTGSTSIHLKKSGEYLPGRRGEGKDVFLYPLSFFEFLKLFYPKAEQYKFDGKFSALKNFCHSVKVAVPDLPEKTQTFFLTGGFLRVINESSPSGTINSSTVELYKSWLKSEMAKNEKKEVLVRVILEKVFESLATGISYQSVAQYADLGSHNTARDYLQFLKDSFFLLEAPLFVISQKRVLWRKNKKFYCSDPFIFWLLFSFVFGGEDVSQIASRKLKDPDFLAKFVENLVGTEISKKGKELFYYQNRREIDFVFQDDTLPIEVKYQRRVIPADFSYLKKGIVISKSDFFVDKEVLVLPLDLFLLLG